MSNWLKRASLFDFSPKPQGWYNDDKNIIGITPMPKTQSVLCYTKFNTGFRCGGFGIGGNESSAFEVLPKRPKQHWPPQST